MELASTPYGVFIQCARINPPMVCLYHGDYGPADAAFSLSAPSQSGVPGWVVDARLLKDARNIGEAEAIQRHVIRGESVSWCDQGYNWAEQDAVAWFYLAVLLFVVLPYLIFKVKARTNRGATAPKHAIDSHSGLPIEPGLNGF